MGLLIWALVVGIILLVVAATLLVILVTNAKAPLLSKLLLTGAIMVLSFAGFACIGGFIFFAVLDIFIDVADELSVLCTSLVTLAGTGIGFAIASKYQSVKKEKCANDPECELM